MKPDRGWRWPVDLGSIDYVVGGTLLVVLLILLLGCVALFGGCSTRTADLDRMQRDTQNCVLSGGTPRLGPDRSVLCL